MIKNNNKSNIYYEQVAESITNKINSGFYKYGEKIPSERELCDCYSVSRTTIRKAIDELVSAGYLVKQQGKGTFISKTITKKGNDKRVTGNILFVRCIHSDKIATISSFGEDIFYPKILTGIEEAATENGYHCMFKNIDENKLDIQEVDELLKKVDGVIWGGELHNKYFLNHLLESEIPLVLISPSIKVDNVDSVNIDNRYGANKGVKYLLKNGHQRIAYIGGIPNSFPLEERKRGYYEALEEGGIETDESLTISYGWRFEDGYKAMLDLLDRKCEFTAVFAASDILAIGAINALKENNYSLPRDISVLGFDDIDLASQLNPSLTTIKVLKSEMGKVAGGLLFERLSGKRDYQLNVSLPTKLIIRESIRNIK